jgi:hypothetical protein
MNAKMIEVRDRGTFIPMLAILLDSDNDQAAWLLRQAGFRGPDHYVLLCKISGGSGHYKCTADPFDWGVHDRTYSTVHRYLQAHFEEVKEGQVLDVEVILGEKETPKVSQRFSVVK